MDLDTCGDQTSFPRTWAMSSFGFEHPSGCLVVRELVHDFTLAMQLKRPFRPSSTKDPLGASEAS